MEQLFGAGDTVSAGRLSTSATSSSRRRPFSSSTLLTLEYVPNRDGTAVNRSAVGKHGSDYLRRSTVCQVPAPFRRMADTLLTP